MNKKRRLFYVHISTDTWSFFGDVIGTACKTCLRHTIESVRIKGLEYYKHHSSETKKKKSKKIKNITMK